MGCNHCGAKRVPVHYCDKCGTTDQLYYFDDEELCLDCIEERLDKVEDDF
jgi:hypothetical protein